MSVRGARATILGAGGAARSAAGALSAAGVHVSFAARQQARADKDFATADAIRDSLTAAGIVIEDTADGARWSLVNASPDVRDQLARAPGLWPRAGTRDVPLDTVVVTNADIDHVLGLLVLREALPHRIVTTAWIRDALLDHNAAFRLLEPAFHAVKLDEPFFLDRGEALEFTLRSGRVVTLEPATVWAEMARASIPRLRNISWITGQCACASGKSNLFSTTICGFPASRALCWASSELIVS